MLITKKKRNLSKGMSKQSLLLLFILLLSSTSSWVLIPRGVVDVNEQHRIRETLEWSQSMIRNGEMNEMIDKPPSIGRQLSSISADVIPSPLAKMLLNHVALREDSTRPRSEQLLMWDYDENSGEPWIRVVFRVRDVGALSRALSFIKSASLPSKIYRIIESPFPLMEISFPISKASAVYYLFVNDPTFQYFEPEVLLHATSTVDAATINDPLSQWGLDVIDAPQAWTVTTGSKKVKVAIIDSGVDLDHPDLQDNIGSLGHDWVEDDDVPNDVNGHGTHVAGIVAAVMNNSLGIAGIANITLHVERILDASGAGSPLDAILAIENAVKSGARVITASWGSFGSSQLLKDIKEWAFDQGALIIAAAGNYGQHREFYPAAFPKVLAVSAVSPSLAHYSLSNRGPWVDVAAPGVNIRSAIPGGGYGNKTGTSMAAPHVAGVAALALSIRPSLSAQMLMNVLRYGTEDLGTAGRDDYYGYGLINASKVVHLLQANDKTPLLATLTHDVSTPFVGEIITGTLELHDIGSDDLGIVDVLVKLDNETLVHQFSGINMTLNGSFMGSYEWKLPESMKVGSHDLVILVMKNDSPLSVLDLSYRHSSRLYVAPHPNYVVLQSSPTDWVLLDGTNSQVLTLEDDDSRSISLPFNFSFLDVATDKVWIDSNGMLSFKQPIVDYYSRPLPVFQDSYSTMLAFAWTDLSPPNNPLMQIRVNVTSTRAIIQFLSMGHYVGGFTLGDVQVVLWKDGTIDIQYRKYDFSRDVGVVMGINLGRIPRGLESVNATWSLKWTPPTWKGDVHSIRILPRHLKTLVLMPQNGNLSLNSTKSTWIWHYNGENLSNSTTIAQYQLYLDNELVSANVPSSSQIQVNHSVEGRHHLGLHVKDTQGNEFWENVTFLVDLSNPTMLFNLPPNGTTLAPDNGSFLISWNAADAHSPVFVTLYLDNWPLAEGTNGSIIVTNWGNLGPHVLLLVAKDSAGNVLSKKVFIRSTSTILQVDGRFRLSSSVSNNGPFLSLTNYMMSIFPIAGYSEWTLDETIDRYSLASIGLMMVPHFEFFPAWWQARTLLEWGSLHGGLLYLGPPASISYPSLIEIQNAFLSPLSVELLDLNALNSSSQLTKESIDGPILAEHPLVQRTSRIQWLSSTTLDLVFRRLSLSRNTENNSGTGDNNPPFELHQVLTVEHAIYHVWPANNSQSSSFEMLDLLLPFRALDDLSRRMLFFPDSALFRNASSFNYPETLASKMVANMFKWFSPEFYDESVASLTFLRPRANEHLVVDSSSSPVSIIVDGQVYVTDPVTGMELRLLIDDNLVSVNETSSFSRPIRFIVTISLDDGEHQLSLQLYSFNGSNDATKISEAHLTFYLESSSGGDGQPSITGSVVTSGASTEPQIAGGSIPLSGFTSGMTVIFLVAFATIFISRRRFSSHHIEKSKRNFQ